MEFPDKRIINFIMKHHVLTLATCSNGVPWCANCFYTYLEKRNWLVFTSNDPTRHAREAAENPRVAGSIVLETSVIGKIRGIQFSGIMRKPHPEESSEVNLAYLKRFPFAVLMDTSLWVLELQHLKMTDNRLGFGKKLIWDKA